MKKIIGMLALTVLNIIGIQTASAKIYTCVINGEVIYTSRHSGNCQAADLPPIGRYSSSRYDEPQVYTPSAAKSEVKKQAGVKRGAKPDQAAIVPAKYTPPTVTPQKLSGSNSRRRILEQELANERKALSEAQQSLTSARAAKGGSIDQQQITQLQGNVLDRQQNIQALQRELGRM